MHPSHKWLTQHLYNDMGNDNCDGNSSSTNTIHSMHQIRCECMTRCYRNKSGIFSVYSILCSSCKDLLQFRGFATHLFSPKTGGIEHLSALFLWHHEKKRARAANFCNVLLSFIFVEISFNTVSFTLITKLRAASVEDAEKSIAIKSNVCEARLSNYLN